MFLFPLFVPKLKNIYFLYNLCLWCINYQVISCCNRRRVFTYQTQRASKVINSSPKSTENDPHHSQLMFFACECNGFNIRALTKYSTASYNYLQLRIWQMIMSALSESDPVMRATFSCFKPEVSSYSTHLSNLTPWKPSEILHLWCFSETAELVFWETSAWMKTLNIVVHINVYIVYMYSIYKNVFWDSVRNNFFFSFYINQYCLMETLLQVEECVAGKSMGGWKWHSALINT